jgi:hypothetical protein
MVGGDDFVGGARGGGSGPSSKLQVPHSKFHIPKLFNSWTAKSGWFAGGNGGFNRVEGVAVGFTLQRLATNQGRDEENVMKKFFLILGAAAALILAGCDRGGTSDAYNTSNGNASGAPAGGTNQTATSP